MLAPSRPSTVLNVWQSTGQRSPEKQSPALSLCRVREREEETERRRKGRRKGRAERAIKDGLCDCRGLRGWQARDPGRSCRRSLEPEGSLEAEFLLSPEK